MGTLLLSPQSKSQHRIFSERDRIMSCRIVLVPLLLFLAIALPTCLARGNGFKITCYIKTEESKTFGGLVAIYTTSTKWEICAPIAAEEIKDKCKDAMPDLTRDCITKNICNKMEDNMPKATRNLKVPIYLTGRAPADCKSATAKQFWMKPVAKGVVCCRKKRNGGIVGCKK